MSVPVIVSSVAAKKKSASSVVAKLNAAHFTTAPSIEISGTCTSLPIFNSTQLCFKLQGSNVKLPTILTFVSQEQGNEFHYLPIQVLTHLPILSIKRLLNLSDACSNNKDRWGTLNKSDKSGIDKSHAPSSPANDTLDSGESTTKTGKMGNTLSQGVSNSTDSRSKDNAISNASSSSSRRTSDKSNYSSKNTGTRNNSIGRSNSSTLAEVMTLPVAVAAASRGGYAPGYKDENQDTGVVLIDISGRHRSCLLAVFDGHGLGGHHVSRCLRDHLPMLFAAQARKAMSAVKSLGRMVANLDRHLNASGVDINNSGSTGVLVHLRGNQLTSAWLGDSRAVLARQPSAKEAENKSQKACRWEVVPLTFDHKPDIPAERSRITQAGGRVAQSRSGNGIPGGPFRLWLKGQDWPGLAMSRAFGDVGARPAGLSVLPEHVRVKLTPRDRFVVVASDGVWEFMSNEEVVALVGGCLEGCSSECAEDTLGTHADQGVMPMVKCTIAPRNPHVAVKKAAAQLVEEAHRRWIVEYRGRYIDDITAIVMKLSDT